jgi:hypothetical protein
MDSTGGLGRSRTAQNNHSEDRDAECQERPGGVMIVAAVSSVARAADSDALKPGMVLDQSNWKLAEGLLPPEILKHYEEGGYSNAIVDFPLGSFNWPPDFKPRPRRTPASSSSARPARWC